MKQRMIWCIGLASVALHAAAGGRTYYVSPSGSDARLGGSEGAAFRTLRKAHDTARAGDTILVKAGTYHERIVFSRGGSERDPVVWKTFGDGDVVWTYTNAVPPYTGAMIYVPNSTSTGYIAPVNDVHFIGSPGSCWVWSGATRGEGPVVGYGDAAHTQTRGWVFQYARFTDNRTFGSMVWSGAELTVEDCVVTHNANGLVILGDETDRNNAARLPAHHVIRRCTLMDNGRGGNQDGCILQDVDFVLFEGNRISGQYDGFDGGSACSEKDGASAIGPRFIIARFNTATGSNGVMPISDARHGPYSLLYNRIYDNHDWGAVPVYSSSGHVHLWNNTFADNRRAVTFQPPSTGPLHFVNNLVHSREKGAVALVSNGQPVFKRNNYLAGASYPAPSARGEADRVGSADSVKFSDTSRNYPITGANAALIDRGEFFLHTAAAGVATTLITPRASYAEGPSDPRVFFWIGDTIEIEGVGIRTITGLTADRITVDVPVSFPAHVGLHYPYSGAGPDIGASEYGRLQTLPSAPLTPGADVRSPHKPAP